MAMKEKRTRGVPIGGISSQAIGNLSMSVSDHYMTRIGKGNPYIRYCDDVVGLARTKGEAKRMLRAFIARTEASGLVVKANAVISPIGFNHEGKVQRAHKRKRQRGGRGKGN